MYIYSTHYIRAQTQHEANYSSNNMMFLASRSSHIPGKWNSGLENENDI